MGLKKQGIIICGFPGIGKSSIAGWNNCIDLESSNFSRIENGYISSGPVRVSFDWASLYCELAVQLASQGYTVLTSTHSKVIDIFTACENNGMWTDTVVGAVIFCPHVHWKDEWIERLKKRYDKDPSGKNARALYFASYQWDKIYSLVTNETLPVVQPDSVQYDLKDYILEMQKYSGNLRDYICDIRTRYNKRGIP